MINLYYTANKYTITFYLDGEQYGQTQTVTYGTTLDLAKAAKRGYTVTNWCSDEECTTETNLTRMPAYDVVLYAKSTVNVYSYVLVHHYLDRDGNEVGFVRDETPVGFYNDPMIFRTKDQRPVYEGKTYIYSHDNLDGRRITDRFDRNVVDIYYDIDDLGGGPDQTPDKNQVQFTYVAGDGGAVSKSSEIVTKTNGKASPSGATATANDGFLFDSWSDGNTTDADPGMANFTARGYEKDTVFTANFAAEAILPVEPSAPVETITDDPTPLAQNPGGCWALVNLIITILTVLGSILLLIFYFGKKQKALVDENGNPVLNAEGEEALEYTRKKKGFWRIFSIIPAVVAVVVFILTENMRLPMVLVDRWTILMVIIGLVQIVVALLSKKKKEEPEEEAAAMV